MKHLYIAVYELFIMQLFTTLPVSFFLLFHVIQSMPILPI